MLVTTTAYFPPLRWFLAATRQGGWHWETHETYQKGGWRNRCRIAAANGPLLLSIPLKKGKHQQLPITQVRISYREDWPRRHAQAIRSAYGRAPYFEHYGPPLLDLLKQEQDSLWDYNFALTGRLLELLQSPFSIYPTKEFSGAAAGVNQATGSHPAYRQVFEERHGYLEGLSVLDGLFCLGPALPLLAQKR